MAKVRRGLISVRCSELGGVCFSEVRNVFYGKINQGQVICPLYRGCLLLGESVIRGFTVVFFPPALLHKSWGTRPGYQEASRI